jgi:hypothetical protein
MLGDLNRDRFGLRRSRVKFVREGISQVVWTTLNGFEVMILLTCYGPHLDNLALFGLDESYVWHDCFLILRERGCLRVIT